MTSLKSKLLTYAVDCMLLASPELRRFVEGEYRRGYQDGFSEASEAAFDGINSKALLVDVGNAVYDWAQSLSSESVPEYADLWPAAPARQLIFWESVDQESFK